ncbi:MFS transporter [Hamadaea sp. NPDC051192]|uniref:MFS transporter n=1 Tax=Hamadaea sp. NPDC051192 TaxID=3154940 RepID=UPI00344315AC
MTERQKKIGMLLCVFTIVMAVIDNNIVSAAVVPIVRELDPVHGVDRLPWLVSAFALAATAMLPLYGKLCDVFGPKLVYLGAIATFLAGSALCGAAQSMGQLIAFRALQGAGAGGLMSVTMVVLAHLAGGPGSGSARGGNFGGVVAGAGMALGPFLGGILADHGQWRWIFYLNLPIGLLILIVSARLLRLPKSERTHRIDFLGAGLAAAFAVGLLLISEWAGKEYAWDSPTILGLVVATLALLGAFLWRQAVAAEPILPLSLFRNATISLGFAIQGLMGLTMMGSMVYVMVYLQVVRGVPAAQAGLYLIPMAAGLTVVGMVAGKLSESGVSRKGLLVSGTAIGTLAIGSLTFVGADTNLWYVRGSLFVLGIGFGQLLGLLIAVVQQAAPRTQLGVATTAIRFFQNLGGALGAAVLGTILSRAFTARMPGMSTSAVATMTGDVRTAAVNALVHSMDLVFMVATGAMAVSVVLALMLRMPVATPEPAAQTTLAPEPAKA